MKDVSKGEASGFPDRPLDDDDERLHWIEVAITSWQGGNLPTGATLDRIYKYLTEELSDERR